MQLIINDVHLLMVLKAFKMVENSQVKDATRLCLQNNSINMPAKDLVLPENDIVQWNDWIRPLERDLVINLV